MIASNKKQNHRALKTALFLAVAGAVLIPAWAQRQKSEPASAPNAKFSPVTVSTAGYRSAGDRHKLSVSDRGMLPGLQAQGGRVIADYGSYVLLEVSDAVAKNLSDRGTEIVDENNLVLLNAGAIDTRSEKPSRSAVASRSGKQMRLIQFAGPVRPEWYQALAETGVRIVTYIPNNAYLVYGPPKAMQALQMLASNKAISQWDGDYTAAFRLDPAVVAASRGTGKDGLPMRPNLSDKGNEQFTIQMVEDADENKATLALIEQFKLEPIIKENRVLGYLNVRVTLPREVVIGQIAERTDVVSIQQWITPRKRDERQNFIMTGAVTGSPAVPVPGDWLAYLAGKGYSTSTVASFGVNLSDSGIDNATTTPNHFGLYRLGDSTVPGNSRVMYNRLVGTPNTGSTLQGCDGHGNENAHIIAGYIPTGTVNGVNFGAAPHADALGFRYGLGLAPFVKVGSSVIFDPGTFTSPNYSTLESQAYRDGARISSNSWGSSSNLYTVDAQEYDALVRDAQPAGSTVPVAGNQEYIIVFAAGNGGSGPNTVGEPSTAKNVITVGAAENVNPFGGADGCGIGDTGADNANDIISFSSRGPTSDGRKKPDIVAPGTHVSSSVAQASIVAPPGSGTGAQLACFNGGGVCGGVGSNFFPAGQQWYTASSGTSHSTPATAGTAALIRQDFINRSLTPPSPAMTKALLMNSARYMTGVGANDSLPSNTQGMGEVNINGYFDTFATAHVFRDQRAVDTFTASGQQRVITGTVTDPSKPFRVTLAWTDVPGPTSGSAFVNNLDLEVTIGGNTYKGNVFAATGGYSATGGTADTRNNVESVFLPAGVTGSFIIKVKATNIAGDGVPGDANLLDQDFALVAYNITEAPLPVVSSGATAVNAESCVPANGAIDPGETVTVNFDLSNIGTANTTNLVATLQATGGVTAPSAPQNYGALAANGAAVTRPFTFTAGTTCGQTITATLNLQDGASNLGAVTFTFSTGALGAPVTATYSTGNIATAIPDSGSVDIPIVVSDNGVVTGVKVSVRLDHTYDGDVQISLVSPGGVTVPLVTNRGGSGDNFGTGTNDCSGTYTVFDDGAATAISAGTSPFAGSFKPETPLSALAGGVSAGTWTVHFADTAAVDTGTVGCVKLDITRQRFVCCGVVGAPQIAGGSVVVTAENFFPANGRPDPGETVTISVPVLNIGDGNTSNLVATLQNSGGVTPVTGNQSYGVVLAAGPSVSLPFTFVAGGACGGSITATIHFQDGALDLGNVTYTFTLGGTTSGTQTFSNAATITIPAAGTGDPTGAPSAPYPSTITVSGAPSTITAVTVSLLGFSHTFPDDVDILLVSPTGQKMIIVSDAGGSTDAVGLNLTISDAAATAISDAGPLASGTFKPANYLDVQDPFPAPAPAGPYLTPAPGGTDTLTSAFTGVAGGNPNGVWSLYVVDDAGTDTGAFAGGWQLSVTNTTPVCGTLVTASSRKMQGGTPFDTSLPLAGNMGIECRRGSGANNNDHQVVVQFANPVTVGAATVTSGVGSVASFTVVGSVVTVNLTGVANAQRIMITLSGVSDGVSTSSVSVPMAFLLGDTTGDGVVDIADITQTRRQTGQVAGPTNYRQDLTGDGVIDIADITLVRRQTGTALP